MFVPKRETSSRARLHRNPTAGRRQRLHRTSSLLAIGLEDPKEDLSHACAGSGKQVAGFHTGTGSKALGLTTALLLKQLVSRRNSCSTALDWVLAYWDGNQMQLGLTSILKFLLFLLEALPSPIYTPLASAVAIPQSPQLALGLMLLLYHHTTWCSQPISTASITTAACLYADSHPSSYPSHQSGRDRRGCPLHLVPSGSWSEQ